MGVNDYHTRMAVEGALVTAVFMLLVVVPMLGVTWHSVRSDHHSPPAVQRREGRPGDEP